MALLNDDAALCAMPYGGDWTPSRFNLDSSSTWSHQEASWAPNFHMLSWIPTKVLHVDFGFMLCGAPGGKVELLELAAVVWPVRLACMFWYVLLLKSCESLRIQCFQNILPDLLVVIKSCVQAMQHIGGFEHSAGFKLTNEHGKLRTSEANDRKGEKPARSRSPAKPHCWRCCGSAGFQQSIGWSDVWYYLKLYHTMKHALSPYACA